MLQRIHIENYKCLRDVSVELGDFTILIGPNDSGKSSFLEVIRMLGKIGQGSIGGALQGDRSLENLVWRKDAGRSIVWDVAGSVAEHRFAYHLELPLNRPPPESLEWDGEKLFWTQPSNPMSQLLGNAGPVPPGGLFVVMARLVGRVPVPLRQGHRFCRNSFSNPNPRSTQSAKHWQRASNTTLIWASCRNRLFRQLGLPSIPREPTSQLSWMSCRTLPIGRPSKSFKKNCTTPSKLYEELSFRLRGNRLGPRPLNSSSPETARPP